MPTEQNDPGRIASDEAAWTDRLAFLGLSESDAERLRELAPRFAERQNEFVEAFYRHLFAFAGTRRFLQDPQRLARLKIAQWDHFESLLRAEWDETYLASRRRVGDAHADVGIEPQFFLGAYSQYIQFCCRELLSTNIPAEDFERLVSFLKAVFLDIGLSLDAYFEQSTQALRNALDMLWKANEELRQFAQLTTHDLKTPLATVANLCDEAVDEFGDQMPDDARRLIEAARQSTFRMSGLIDELLAAALRSGSSDAVTEVDVGKVVDGVLDRLRPQIADKRIEIVLPGTWPRTWTHAVRFGEALFNVLSNAVKFVGERGGRIEVRAEETPQTLRVSVCDNGPGIPAEELERIFVPFRRLPEHRSRPGSGLGLYFAKNLVETMGGRIRAESVVGRGSTFHIDLPRENAGRRRAP